MDLLADLTRQYLDPGASPDDWDIENYKVQIQTIYALDPEAEVAVLNGTREGLFLAALAAKGWDAPRAGPPAILLPNPFYAVYAAGAAAAGCELVFLDATVRSGFLPDLESIEAPLLSRAVALYLASPSNPQGAVADRRYLGRAAALAPRRARNSVRSRSRIRWMAAFDGLISSLPLYRLMLKPRKSYPSSMWTSRVFSSLKVRPLGASHPASCALTCSACRLVWQQTTKSSQ